MTLATKALLSGRYEILSSLGAGGMSEVYLAQDLRLDRKVAIKILRDQFHDDKELLEQFLREAKSAARLKHPYIINIYDVCTDGEDNYIVMEYVEGMTLKHYMEQHRLSLGNVLDIGIRLSLALQHAHNRNVVHCDIKPLNILIDKSLVPKLTDFGIAKIISNQTLVYSNSIMGSVHYISPEQANNGKVTHLSDIYSLGVVLFEMLTGCPPYDGGSPIAVAMMHVEKPVPQLTDYLQEVPEGLQPIIDKCMAKAPEDRYQSAAELRQGLMELKNRLQLEDTGVPAEILGAEQLGGEEPLEQALDPLRSTVVMPPVHGAESGTDLADTLIIHKGSYAGAVGTEPPLEEKIKNALEELTKKEEERKAVAGKRRINYTRLLLLITAFFVVIGIIGHFLLGGPKQQVEVPDVVNMTVVDAQKKLEALDLRVELEEKFADQDKFKPGSVVEQSIKAGVKRKQGTTVVLYISKGAELKAVPDVKNTYLTKASVALENAGFKVGKIERKYVKGQPVGIILEQIPKADEKTPKGSEISLVVCEGDKAVPALIGKTQEEAKSILAAAGLSLGSVNTITDASHKRGIIVSINPDAGTKLGEGDKVNITVSEGNGINTGGYVDFAIPGSKMCKVVIYVDDANGRRTIFSGMKKGGIRIRQKVETEGAAKAVLSVDGAVVEEKSL